VKSLLIIGSGGHARVAAETATLIGKYRILGFADENLANKDLTVDRWAVLGDWHEINADEYFVAIGKNNHRERIFKELISAGRTLSALIHPFSYISPTARIGTGTVVLAGAVIQLAAQIGDNVIINAGAIIDHDAKVGDHSHIGLNSVVRSFAEVEPAEFLGPGQIRERTDRPH
jgi:acetyltransferase EpsM